MDENQSNKKPAENPADIQKKKESAPASKVKKDSLIWILVDAFMPKDIKSYKTNLLKNIIAPSIKKQIIDAAKSFFYDGEAQQTETRGVNYNAVSWRNGGSNSSVSANRNYSGITVIEDITVNSEEKAKYVLRQLDDIIATYKFAKVADLCELAEWDSTYPDNDYGWKSLYGARIVEKPGFRWGFVLPRPIPIK